MNRVRQRLVDVVAVTAVTAFIAVVSQRWTGFNSPDSEFYASLALFGSAVTERAVEPAYYATRLGYIAPVRLLVTAFGPWIGFEVWRVFLLLLIVGAVYSVVHVAGRSRWLGVLLAVAVGLNTIVLGFAGNTYLTGTILAALFLLIALSVSLLGHAAGVGLGVVGGPRWTTALISGVVAGWLLMLNPYALVLGSGLWISIRLVVLIRLRTDRWRRLLVDSAAAAVGFVSSGAAFMAIGLWIFPQRNWLQTYLNWNSRLDYTVFIGDATTWQRDAALVVIVTALVASVVAAVAQPRHRWAWAALALSSANILVTVILMVTFTGPWLETPTYVAKLWPAALMSFVLVFTSLSPGSKESKPLHDRTTIAALIITTPLLIWAGRFAGTLPYRVAWLIGLIVMALIASSSIYIRRRWDHAGAVLLVISIAITFLGAQLLQNGRGLLGTYGQYPLRSAYVDFSFDDQMDSKITAQRWLLEKTSPQDSILLWTDPARLTADIAAMQLWGGYNLAGVNPELSRNEIDRLEAIRPSIIAMYAPDREQIDSFFASLPPWSLPTDPECLTVPYLGIGSGQAIVCLTRLTWVG